MYKLNILTSKQGWITRPYTICSPLPPRYLSDFNLPLHSLTLTQPHCSSCSFSHSSQAPVSGPLYLPFPLPGMCFPRLPARLTPSPSAGFYSNINHLLNEVFSASSSHSIYISSLPLLYFIFVYVYVCKTVHYGNFQTYTKVERT